MHINSLDGLRGLAAYTVVISHFSLVTRSYADIFGLSGQVGVMIFFVLSGFLMGKYVQSDFTLPNVVRYYQQRFSRVIPLYLIVVLLSFGTLLIWGRAWPFFPIGRDTIWEHLFSSVV